jgi:hypothetical protein
VLFLGNRTFVQGEQHRFARKVGGDGLTIKVLPRRMATLVGDRFGVVTSTDTKRPLTAFSDSSDSTDSSLDSRPILRALLYSLLLFSFLYLVKYTRFSGELLSSQSAIISRLNSAQRYILSVRYILPTPSSYLYLPLGLFDSSLPFVRLLPLHLPLRLLPLSYSFLVFIFIFSVR